MAKRGRPKKQETEDKIFVGMQMSEDLAKLLSKDSAKNFRTRGQHILWILTDYLKKSNESESTNQPIYTEEEVNDMYKQYKEQGGK